MKPAFQDGVLLLPSWRYSLPDARVPHRSYTLACHRLGDGSHVCVNRNHRSFKPLYWIAATGPGFSGDRSKLTNTVTTRSEKVAQRWIAAVQSGNVRIA